MKLRARAALVSAVAVFTILVTPAISSAQTYPIPNQCTVAPTPPGTCQPAGITTGPDGNVWFTQEHGGQIGRITPGGTITLFATPAGAEPVEIAAGGDGRLWFTESGTRKIGAIDPITGQISHYPSGSTTTAPPDGITAGPPTDPNTIWFTEYDQVTGTSRIGRMTTAGDLTNQFTPSGSGPGDITVGPDNRLWFTQSNGKIGAIRTDGSPTQYPTSVTLSDPSGITASGATLWFTEHNGGLPPGQVRRIDTEGNVGPPTQVGTGPSAIATGADGYLWFTEEAAGKIGRISTSGAFAGEFPASSPGAQPGGITAGPDGALWYTEFVGNAIGRIATSAGGGGGGTVPPPPPPSPPGGGTTAKKKCKVPKLRGLTLKKAKKKLRKAGCKAKFRGKGRVRSSKPKAGRTTTGRVTVKLAKRTRR